MIEFFVAGAASPQGSKRAFPVKGRIVLAESSRNLGAWRKTIGDVAQHHADRLLEGPVILDLDFRMPRPKSLPKRQPVAHTKRPDLSKLVRAVEDALTHVLLHDDAQVVRINATKRYARPEEPPGVLIRIVHVDLSNDQWAASS